MTLIYISLSMAWIAFALTSWRSARLENQRDEARKLAEKYRDMFCSEMCGEKIYPFELPWEK